MGDRSSQVWTPSADTVQGGWQQLVDGPGGQSSITILLELDDEVIGTLTLGSETGAAFDAATLDLRV